MINRLTLAVLATLTLGVTACAPNPASVVDSASAPAVPAASAFPAQVTNCGRTVRVTAPPQRIVSFFPSNTELLLALGLKDRIAGHVWANQSPPKPAYAADYNRLTVLADGQISRESLFAARPDFVLADGEYNFDGKQLPTIAELEKLGVPVYVGAAFCPATTGTATLADATADLDALGALLGVPDAAAKARADVDRTLADLRQRLSGRPAVPAAMVQIFDKQLYALAGGLYSDILRTSGATDVLAGMIPEGRNFDAISAEAVAKADPEVIIYHHTSEDDRAAGEQWLRTHLAQTRAVRNNRLVATPAADYAELRAIDGVRTLARALHPEAF
ncbi:ABC transporter substrate-binding protein [Acrocarpospora catenulata]|uniref:ABC transporter substrate-binding protein n=1 Tax=Acrocarpospora catenulata TaxID=2836182 RepID=UPI001BDAC9AC|nr:ABC transporter substrate-binding protein [Acrocarpospora catenulata]